ncbi:MAG TPA: DUF4350 domain-containing protein [Pyrinomonadaceae bacterium]|jgi:hypothetical protein|nr:DUF4350 domain-containing protein [Pyrinomonadaceae bacterium]
MKGRLAIFLTVVVMVFVLVALNAASYVRVESEREFEMAPDRSTLNTGPTGTRAFYDYLKETGRDVSRWGQPFRQLNERGRERPQTLVVVGPTRVPFGEDEAPALLQWLREGGRLVVISREPGPELMPSYGGWRVSARQAEAPGPDVRPDDVETMTRGVPLLAPSQPTPLVRDVAQVTRSRFAARLQVIREPESAVAVTGIGAGPPPSIVADDDNVPPPAPKPTAGIDYDRSATPAEPPPSPAPVEHIYEGGTHPGALLVDYVYGRGRVVVLGDPYVVSNAGINRADNLLLAANVVGDGPVAFDEYHHGYGTTGNKLFAYFAGTPVIWMFGQAAVVVLAVVWTRGRRFARPLPSPRPDRRSKLEFVASMAELQQRARAYDLAIENVYTRTRRALARYGGLPATATIEQIAERVAARSGRNSSRLSALMRECEDAVAGSPLSARRALSLARELRTVERDLGIQMRAREIRQAETRSNN